MRALRPPGLHDHAIEPGSWRRLVERQAGDQHRHLVAEGVARVGAADVDRHHDAEVEARRGRARGGGGNGGARPARTASTTSLSVPPSCRIPRMVSIGVVAQSNRRCGPMWTLNGVGDAGRSAGRWPRRSPTRPRAPPRRRRADRTRLVGRPPSAAIGAQARCASSDASSAAGDGAGRGTQRGAAARGGRVGGRLHHRARQLDASDPVDHAVMHLGDEREVVRLHALDDPHLPERLPRSSCCDMMRPASRLSWRTSPGCGRWVWRRW